MGKLHFAEHGVTVYPNYDPVSNWMMPWSKTVEELHLLKGDPYIVMRVERVTRGSGIVEDIVTILCTHGICVTWAWMLPENKNNGIYRCSDE